MRSNRPFAIVAIAFATASAVTTAAIDIYAHAVAAVHRAWDYVSTSFRTLPNSSPPKAQADLNPVLLLVAAKAFIGRMSKRERPRVTPLWRMCPSI